MTKPACKNCDLWSINSGIEYIKDKKGSRLYSKQNSGKTITWEEYSKLHRVLRREYEPVTKPKPGESYFDTKGLHGKWGYCKGIPFAYDYRLTEDAEKEIPNAVCVDGSSYSASVETSEDFFCANFKPRD